MLSDQLHNLLDTTNIVLWKANIYNNKQNISLYKSYQIIGLIYYKRSLKP